MKIGHNVNPILFVVLVAATCGHSIRLVDGIYLSHVSLFLLFVFCVLELIFSEVNRKYSKWFLILFFVQTILITISLFESSEAHNVKQIAQIFLLFVGFFVSYSLCCMRAANLASIINTLLLGFLVNAAFGLFQSIAWIFEHGFVLVSGNEWFRVSGLNVSPSDYVSQLFMGLFLLLALPNLRLRMVLVFMCLLLLLISMSRSAMVILMCLSALFFFRLDLAKKMTTIFALCILSFSLLALDAQNFLLVQRVTDIANYDFNIKRLLVYEDVLDKTFASAASTMFGSGYGSYSFYHPLDDQWYDNTHSVYLNFLFGGGLFGLIFFLISAGFSVAIFSSFKHDTYYHYSKGSILRPIWLKYLLIMILIVALVENNLLGVGTGWLVTYMMGIAYFIKGKKGVIDE